ncbi:hypothetical protein PS15p_201892 [Mucor circinelloides]
MDNNNLDLDGQTAPESTRGLFDFPDSPSSAIRRSDWIDKRRSIELGPRGNNAKSFGVAQQQQQRSSGLHTVNEEDFYNQKQQRKYNRESISFQNQDDYHQLQQRDSYDSSTSSTLFQRKQRSSVAHFNNFPLSKRPDELDDTTSNRLSRADVLAETEAKLNGHNHAASTNRFSSSSNNRSFDDKQSRRLSEPSTRIYNYGNSYSQPQQQQQDYYSDRPAFGNNKRMSYQQSSSSSRQYGLDSNDAASRRLSLSKLNLMDVDKRSSGRDWRSKSPTSMAPIASSTSSSRPSSMINHHHRLSTGSSIMESGSNSNGHQRKPLFTSHLPFSSVVPYLKSNMLVSGLLRVNKRNRSDAYVFCEDFNADIYICGSRDRNRALEGDHVAIKLIEVDQVMLEKHEKEEAKLARNNGHPVVRKPDEEDEKEIIFGGEEDVDLVTPKFCGVVVAILDRAQKQVFSGTLGLTRPSNKRKGGDDQQHQQQRDSSVPRIIWFKPTDKRVPLIAIPVEQAPPGFIENSESFENKLFLGSIKRWPITSLHPFGVLESELGVVEDTRVQLRAILADNNVNSLPYNESMLRSIPTNILSTEMIEREIASKERRDMRTTRCITIVDDHGGFLENALSITPVPNTNTFEVGIHVSDITAFISPESVLDKEARSRGVDVYHTIFEKVPLWPEFLKEECTNLVQGKDRFTFSIIWTMSGSGEVMDTWFGKTVINSDAVMTLGDLQNIIDDPDNGQNDLSTDILSLYSISRSLHKSRYEKALFIKPPQLDIRFKNDHYPSSITTKVHLKSECILDELQILANTQVAQKISSHFPDHALLRSQSPPNERKLRELTQYLDSLGYTIHPETPSSLQKSIDAIQNPEARAVVVTLVMKCMSQAKYFCTGAFDINRYHHYANNAPLYTHFCCPTKRYADTIVHRQLEAAIKGETMFFMEPEIVQKTAQQCNVKARAAENANEQTQHMFSSYYLANNSGTSTNRIQDAIVVGVQENAFDVIVPGLGLERRIHTINLPLKSDTYSLSENVLHLIWVQGEATVDAGVETAISTDDDEDDDYDDSIMDTYSVRDDIDSQEDDGVLVDIGDSNDEQIKRLSIKSSSTTALDEMKKSRRRSTSIRAIQGEDAWITQKECTFPNECRQLIRPFDFVKVVVTADPIRSPPLIRVLAANPFVMKQ